MVHEHFPPVGSLSRTFEFPRGESSLGRPYPSQEYTPISSIVNDLTTNIWFMILPPPFKMSEGDGMDEFLHNLGKRIRSLRQKQGLTQEILAEAAGISGKYLGEVERGEMNVSIQVMKKLADALCIQLADIIENRHESSEVVLRNELVSLIETASEGDLRLIYKLIRGVLY